MIVPASINFKKILQSLLTAPWIALFAIYVFALIIRIIFIFHSQNIPEYATFIPALDADMYWRAARFAVTPIPGVPNWELLSTTSGFFVWFLAMVQRVNIDTIFEYRIFSAFLTSLSPVLIFLIAKDGLKSKTTGYIAAIAFALSPSALHFDTIVSKTNLEIVLYLLTVICLLKIIKHKATRKSPYYTVTLGFSLSILALLQKAALLAGVIAALILLVNVGQSLSERARKILIASGVLVTVMVAFNYVLLRDYQTNPVDGYNLYLSLNPDSNGLYHPADNVPSILLGHSFFSRLAAERHTRKRLTFEEGNSFYKNLTLQNVKNNPGKILKVELKKLRLLFNDSENRGEEYFLHLKNELKMFSLNPLTFGVFLIFAPLGLLCLFRQKKYQAILALSVPLITTIAICMTLFPMWRYRYAVSPAIVLLAATGLVYLFQMFRKESKILIAASILVSGIWTYVIFRPIHSEEYLKKSMSIAEENRQSTLKRAATVQLMAEVGDMHPGSTMQRDLTLAKCDSSLYSNCMADLNAMVKTDRSNQLAMHYYLDSLLMLNHYEEAIQFIKSLERDDPNLVTAMIIKNRNSPLINHALSTYILPYK